MRQQEVGAGQSYFGVLLRGDGIVLGPIGFVGKRVGELLLLSRIFRFGLILGRQPCIGVG